jgi:hypothetical protein
MWIPVRRALSQIPSFAASKPAVYSASQEEAPMVFYFFAFQEITPDPSEKAYPPTLHLVVSMQLAQSESVKPSRLI